MPGHKNRERKKHLVSGVLTPITPTARVVQTPGTQIERAVILRTLMKAKISTELDIIDRLIDTDPHTAKRTITALQNTIRIALRDLFGVQTSTVTVSALFEECRIPPGERYMYDISNESSTQVSQDTRYKVFSQGLRIGEDIIEKATVYRISE